MLGPRSPRGIEEALLALDHPLGEICSAFPRDRLSRDALAMCLGMRIICHPRRECLAAFITSSMKQVARIRSMSLAIREAFGGRAGDRFAYPVPDVLARTRAAGWNHTRATSNNTSSIVRAFRQNNRR